MVDFPIYYLFYSLRSRWLPKISLEKRVSSRALVLPLLHSEGYRQMAMPGYLTCDYIGAYHHGFRAGILSVFRKRNWRWVAGKEALFMKKPITLFRFLQIETSVCTWNEKFMVRRTDYYQGDVLCGYSFTQTIILESAGKKVSTQQFFNELGKSLEPRPAFPQEIASWQ